MIDENIMIGENILENTITWKNYRIKKIKNMDILQIVDTILSHESEYNKEYSHKWKNNRYVELKKLKLEDLYELLLNYEILRLTPDNIKNEIIAYKQKEKFDEQLNKKIENNSKVKIVEYLFDDDELKYWDRNDKDNHDEIDLNEFIDWNEINEKAIENMKEYFSKETKFVDIDENSEDDDK